MLAAVQTTSTTPAGPFTVLFFIAAYYVAWGWSMQRIAERTGAYNSWMAWVPVLNIYLLLKICGRNGWEILLFLVPIISILYMIVLMVLLPMRLNRNPVWALGLICPFVDLFVLPYLAVSGA